MKKRNILTIITCMALSAALLTGCGTTDSSNADSSSAVITKADGKISGTDNYFDTVITITLYDTSLGDLINDCFSMAAHYEELFSRTKENSDVSRINASNGEPVKVDSETIELIEYGLKYGELSNGNFDITIGALSDLWDITNNPGVLPYQEYIDEALATVDYKSVVVNNDEVTLTKSGAMLDLGGIAKGFIADKMKAYLVSQGVTSGMINLGGNVLTIGSKPDGSDYNIGIQKPFDDTNASIGYVSIKDKTVVSSGIYERYFKFDDKIYHHLLDTTTGYPIENNLYGVSIICDDSVDGDGLSTTIFSLGIEDGLKLIESLDDTECIFITDDYEVIYSSGLEGIYHSME